MKKELIYPLILEVKVKKECLKRIIFILDKDSIKFLDKNYPKVLLFQTPIEDCEVFLRKSDDILKQEIYLISRSKYVMFMSNLVRLLKQLSNISTVQC